MGETVDALRAPEREARVPEGRDFKMENGGSMQEEERMVFRQMGPHVFPELRGGYDCQKPGGGTPQSSSQAGTAECGCYEGVGGHPRAQAR